MTVYNNLHASFINGNNQFHHFLKSRLACATCTYSFGTHVFPHAGCHRAHPTSILGFTKTKSSLNRFESLPTTHGTGDALCHAARRHTGCIMWASVAVLMDCGMLGGGQRRADGGASRAFYHLALLINHSRAAGFIIREIKKKNIPCLVALVCAVLFPFWVLCSKQKKKK